jgi:hypothetical protein
VPKKRYLLFKSWHTCTDEKHYFKTCPDKEREARSESVTFMDLQETAKRVYQLQRAFKNDS